MSGDAPPAASSAAASSVAASMAAASPPAGSSLAHLPVTLFSAVMGLAGTSLAWRRAAKVWSLPSWPSSVLLAVAVVAFLVVAFAYAAKWLRHPAAARAELRHPIRMTFVPTTTIALLLLATGLTTVAPGVAAVLWWVGALGHLTLTVVVLSAWFGRADIVHTSVTPAWFIPIVGNVVTPLAAAEVGSIELAWFSFGVGLVFWVGLFPLLLQRVLVHDAPLPARLLPTLAIFIAPPAVAVVAWSVLTGDASGPVPRILWAAALMFALLLGAQIGLLRTIPFALPYWAYTFPLAALTVATFVLAGATSGLGYGIIAGVLLAVTTVLVVLVLVRTIALAARGELLRPE